MNFTFERNKLASEYKKKVLKKPPLIGAKLYTNCKQCYAKIETTKKLWFKIQLIITHACAKNQ